MRQKMLNKVTINVPDVDLSAVSGIEVAFEQTSSGVKLIYTEAHNDIEIVGTHVLLVTIPKADAMKLDDKVIRGQVMFTLDSVPQATEIFSTGVAELLKDDGYGS